MSIATRTPSAPGLTVVQPDEGRRGTLMPGVDVVFKIHGDDTGGALSIVEHPFEVGALVPPHVHHLEDEFSIVLEGEIGFRSEDEEVVLGPGGYIVKPHGEVHAMWNAGNAPARMIEVISPPGFEDFFRQAADDPSQLPELAERARLELAQPDWLPDVIARYNLTPPPAG